MHSPLTSFSHNTSLFPFCLTDYITANFCFQAAISQIAGAFSINTTSKRDIGLVGACSNNPKTADTDSLVVKALAFPVLCPGDDDKALREIVDDIHSEKNSVAPGCAACTAPCGNTSDYDMRRIYEAGDGIRKVKLQILEEIQKLAAYVCDSQESGRIPCTDNSFFVKPFRTSAMTWMRRFCLIF